MIDVNLVVDDGTLVVTPDDPAGQFTVTPTPDETWTITTALQVPTPPPWEAHMTATGGADATGDVTVAAVAAMSGAGVAHVTVPVAWATLHTDRPTWADWNGATWSDIHATGSI